MGGLRLLATLALFGGAMLTAGCGVLPDAGPNAIAVKSGHHFEWATIWVRCPDAGSYPHSRRIRAADPCGDIWRPPSAARDQFRDRRRRQRHHFEAAAGGLFIPAEAGVRPGNYVTLPNQPVDTKGFISVPYAGLVRPPARRPRRSSRRLSTASRTERSSRRRWWRWSLRTPR